MIFTAKPSNLKHEALHARKAPLWGIAQRLQNPLMKEYTLNHIRNPTII